MFLNGWLLKIWINGMGPFGPKKWCKLLCWHIKKHATKKLKYCNHASVIFMLTFVHHVDYKTLLVVTNWYIKHIIPKHCVIERNNINLWLKLIVNCTNQSYRAYYPLCKCVTLDVNASRIHVSWTHYPCAFVSRVIAAVRL